MRRIQKSLSTPLDKGVCFALSSLPSCYYYYDNYPARMGDLAQGQENADKAADNDDVAVANNDDNNTSHSKKRSRPETVALQLLELAGRKPPTAANHDHNKRLKSIVIPRRTNLRQQQQQADFLGKTSTGTAPRGRAKTPPVATLGKDAKDDDDEAVETNVSPLQEEQSSDGQFDDASEGEDIPNVDFFAAPTPLDAARPLLALTATKAATTAATTTTPAVRALPQPPPQQQVAGAPLYPPFPVLPPEATTFWGAFQPIAPRGGGVPTTAPRRTNSSATAAIVHNNILPRSGAAAVAPPPPPHGKPKQFIDGPLKEKHPNPLLLPDSRIDESARLRPMPAVASDVTTQQRPVHAPLPTDILLGRGGRSNNHVGNLWFREFIHAYRPSYQRLGKFNKMQLATNLVNYVRHCGGRFLQKFKTPQAAVPEVWWEVGDASAIQKCSQCLREQTKANSPVGGATTNQPPPPPPRKSAAGAKRSSKSGKSSNKHKSSKSTTNASNATSTLAPHGSSTTTPAVDAQTGAAGAVASRRPSTSSSTIATNANDNNSGPIENESKSEQGDDGNDNDSLGVLEI